MNSQFTAPNQVKSLFTIYFFNASRISRRRTISSGGAGGGASGAGFLSLFVTLTTQKTKNDTARKLIAAFTNIP